MGGLLGNVVLHRPLQVHLLVVSMESTGVYWIARHEVLEAQGLQLLLVDTRQLAQVPGRDKKSDATDCEWIQRLHSCGLLRASFRPEEAVCMLRTLVRDKRAWWRRMETGYGECKRVLIK
jgi:transposase